MAANAAMVDTHRSNDFGIVFSSYSSTSERSDSKRVASSGKGAVDKGKGKTAMRLYTISALRTALKTALPWTSVNCGDSLLVASDMS